jgi:hypothetical protein
LTVPIPAVVDDAVLVPLDAALKLGNACCTSAWNDT